MKILIAMGCALLIAITVFACIDDDDGRQACEALAERCLPVGKTAKCDRVAINASPNGSQVEDCIQSSNECDAATACYEGLQPAP